MTSGIMSSEHTISALTRGQEAPLPPNIPPGEGTQFRKGEYGVGKIIPSPPDQPVGHNKLKSMKALADVYLSKESTRTEQLNTANAIIATNITMLTHSRPDLSDIDQVTEAVYNYFDVSAQRNARPTISGIATVLGLSRTEFLSACESGYVKPKFAHTSIALPNEVWQLFTNLRDNYVAMLEGFLETNLIHPSAGIFLLKNNGDYKDVVERSVSINQTFVDVAALADKYKDELDSL